MSGLYSGPIVDIDLHHIWASESELIEYLPARWQRYFRQDPSRSRISVSPESIHYARLGGNANRLEATPPEGGVPGSDYDTMRRQLLDPLGIERAILTFNIGHQGAFHNPQVAVELCRAANDWSIEHWLSGTDDRFFGAIQVPTGEPIEAAKEIRRLASNPRIVEVLMVSNPLNLPFGHPVYHPIYKAAAESGLVVAAHVAGEVYAKGILTAGGMPASRLEQYTLYEQAGMHHLTSIITQGVFEKFPDLRLALVEQGFTWVPWLLWSLDAHYSILKEESSYVHRLPSEYFRDHVWMSTQPFETTPTGDQLLDLLEAFGGFEERLCFASDYPHWNADDVTHIAGRIPRSWWPKVFRENADGLFRWRSTAHQGTG